MNYYRSTQFEARGFNEDEAIKLMLEELTKGLRGRATVKGIEIGIGNGDRVHTFCAFDKVRHTGIDNMKGDGDHVPTDEKVKELESAYPNFFFIKSDSVKAADKFEDEKYDYVFIDGGHEYEQVKADYHAYLPKIKEGGFILLHDSRADEGIRDAVTGTPVNWHQGPTRLKNELTHNKVGAVFSLTIYQV